MEISNDARTILEKPLLGVVSTSRSDGSPHSVPVWFRFDGERIRIWTGEKYGWGRNANARPAVALTVCDSTDRFSGSVTLRGKATVTTGDDDSISREIRQVVGKYLQPEEVDDYLARFTHLRTIVTIEPTFIRAWASAE